MEEMAERADIVDKLLSLRLHGGRYHTDVIVAKVKAVGRRACRLCVLLVCV